MKSKIHIYENGEIRIRYDLVRCIHAEECVRGLRQVFDPDRRPWIDPDQAAADRIAEVIERCPSGALHYEMLSSEMLSSPRTEPVPKNSIRMVKDGPVYISGDLRVVDSEGNSVLEETRVALCRCGASSNKPACDNTHLKIRFRAPSTIQTDRLKSSPESATPAPEGTLLIKLMKNGPYIVEGECEIHDESGHPHHSSGKIALCRCGASASKPFCDGTHRKIGFQA